MRWTPQTREDCTSRGTAATDRIPVWSRIAERVRVARTALSAVVVCSPMLLAARPKTPLRVFGIAAFEYLARLRGGTLGRRRRLTMAQACDLGALRDEYYDHHRLDATEYRSLRRELRRTAPAAATLRYIQRLRQAERCRPLLASGTPGLADAVIAYRTWVLELSLLWLQEISGLSVEPARFHALLGVAGLVQIADDVLDWEDDQASQRPSYVTVLLLDRPCSAVAVPLRAQADALLQCSLSAARQNAGAMPFAVVAALVWVFIIGLLRVRFPQ